MFERLEGSRTGKMLEGDLEQKEKFNLFQVHDNDGLCTMACLAINSTSMYVEM
jgi:hypothetical protein